jgi:predicted nucleotidyltransferase
MAERATRTVEALPPEWEVSRLAQRLREILPEFRARYHIDSICLFGSYVRNEQRPDSDLDLLVKFSETPSLLGLVGAQQDLEEAIGVKVDLVMRSGLRPRFLRYVLREAVPL